MNSEGMAFLFQVINTTVMNLLIFRFMWRIYHPKYRNYFGYIATFVLTTIVFILVNQIGIPIINLTFLFVYINSLSVLMFNSSIRKIFMYNILYTMWLFFCDVLTVAIWTMVKGDNLKKILTNYQYLSISCLLNILIMYLGYQIFVWTLIKNKPATVRKKELMCLGFITFFEVFVLYSLFLDAENKADGFVLILTLAGFLILNLLVVHVIGEISNAYRDKYEMSLVAKQNTMQLEHFNEINHKYEESRKVIHDMKKHLDILSALMQKGENQEQAMNYSRLIREQMDSLLGGFQCTNPILSVIMSQKLETAKQHSIHVNTNVMDVTLDFMRDVDITAIFANLWDNAIEASKDVETEKRFINMIIGRVNNFIIICTENAFQGIIRRRKDKEGFLSTKEKHEGLGLSIIQNTVEQYKGNINIETENNIFKIEILVPIQEKAD